jgi:glycosyltransferase involved in cell wall biosynthesis
MQRTHSAKRIVVVANTSWNIANFRATLIAQLVYQGHGVTVVAPADRYSPSICALGCRYVAMPMANKGKNPFTDLLLIARLWRLFRREAPDCIVSYTPKPNIYAGIAARMLGIPVVANIAGLGSVFVGSGWLPWLVRRLYRIALLRSYRVFFQNRDDLEHFVSAGIVNRASAALLPGSGVDTRRFAPRPGTTADDSFTFLLFGRLLWEKGVRQYVEAARLLKVRYAEARFRIMGFLDVENPSAIGRRQIDEWTAEGLIDFIEARDDVRDAIAEADCVVLPTFYREGTPRTVLEAASMAKPVIVTDSPGCRDAVEDGVTGLLVAARSTEQLVHKLETMLRMPPAARSEMGLRARDKMIRQYDEKTVIDAYLAAIRGIDGLGTARAGVPGGSIAASKDHSVL